MMQNSIDESELPHAVIRFKRDVSFPRFSMAKGERWGFVVYRKWADRLNQIKHGERFEFAGGQCLSQDVDVVFEGGCGREYSIAMGYIPPMPQEAHNDSMGRGLHE
ncbi:hypothetical protein C6571_18850 (plasmid) [Simplicispira suum]|uniref:Uncharacterized protein n=2 Tax=Simplicispira suum TaxID=2109915 RepID=A0A2S0N5U0_9BURK|nr:hypothetical protein C6571_18850 [Simplicispira suum]